VPLPSRDPEGKDEALSAGDPEQSDSSKTPENSNARYSIPDLAKHWAPIICIIRGMHTKEAENREKPSDAISKTREQSPFAETKFRRKSASGGNSASSKLRKKKNKSPSAPANRDFGAQKTSFTSICKAV
jgi:hypothetical protein